MTRPNQTTTTPQVIPLDSAARPARHDHQTKLHRGQVAIIGAGPGDPELLTLRAWKLLRQAEVLVYDRLVGESIPELAPVNCEKIFVGKRCGQHAMSQQQINALLVDRASANKSVVRLKGGDPFIFGRGTEEVEYLLKYGIDYQVVPGITAASGCTSAVGIPLTHRDSTQLCTFVTGHLREGQLQLPWQCLAAKNQTVVFYMGLGNADMISNELQAHGRSAHTPVALIEQGTTDKQRLVISSLGNIAEDIVQYALRPPTLIVVGEVVDFHSLLAKAPAVMQQAVPK